MKTPGKTLRALTAAAALFAAAPSANAERLTDDQRACVARVMKYVNADAGAIQACVAEAGSDDSDKAKKELAPDSLEAQALFATLEARMSKAAPYRPAGVKFVDVRRSLEACPDLLYTLNKMEKTGGMPDVVGVEGNTFVLADVSTQSPAGRRNLPYRDFEAAMDVERMAREMGVNFELMPPALYRRLQKETPLDSKTFSWLLTDPEPLASGIVLFGYRDGDRVRVNPRWAGYRSPFRGFRGLLRVPKS